jgi:hypothetical protein
LGRLQGRRLGRAKTMTKLVEAEAWVRRNKRMIQNQLFIQLLSVIAIVVPLPIAVFVFWTAFGLASPLVIQSFVGLWAAATIVYVTKTIYARIERRKL